tara:strand:- start:31 stop:468 length:438 start_codon:yes stop_codon:yes gene_type:complete
MTSVKIIGSNGFNEGGAVTFTTPTGVVSELPNPALNRQNLPHDYNMYGITLYSDITVAAETLEIVAPIAGRQIEVLSYVFVSDAATTVTFKSDSTAISGGMSVAANGGASSNGDDNGLMLTSKGEGLTITNSAGNIGGHLTYRII